MSEAAEITLRILLIGIGATALTDIWGLLLQRLGIPTLNFAFLGRWIGHLPQGRWFHERIAATAPVKGERWMGWGAHYAIGVAFAALCVSLYGLEWARSPSLLPALSVGIGTVVAPLFVLQPALGAGIASSKTPTPLFNSLKTLTTHAIFGLGLYLAALVTVSLIPVAGG